MIQHSLAARRAKSKGVNATNQVKGSLLQTPTATRSAPSSPPKRPRGRCRFRQNNGIASWLYLIPICSELEQISDHHRTVNVTLARRTTHLTGLAYWMVERSE
ncbi:hypothetical protein RRG08_006588 [Elysia crispata]|uniref:Uncharacterized protein n=1 Tax=Elysia crispata TaxID=231223 RepID=A0AAE1CWU0_9GAST|nr:hypothetical protein RRG08_006588 [Elysia crispata]